MDTVTGQDTFHTNKKQIKIVRIKEKSFCWWDCHAFDTSVVKIPFRFSQDPVMFGCFCSINCAKAYMKHHYMDVGVLNWVCKKMKIVCNISNKIKAAPCPKHLVLFGGTLSISEYRACFTVFEKHIDYPNTKQPMVYMYTKIPYSENPEYKDVFYKSLEKK